METLPLVDLAVGLLLSLYGTLFIVGSARKWRWMTRDDISLAGEERRDFFRLFVFLIGCWLLVVGLYLMVVRGGLIEWWAGSS